MAKPSAGAPGALFADLTGQNAITHLFFIEPDGNVLARATYRVAAARARAALV